MRSKIPLGLLGLLAIAAVAYLLVVQGAAGEAPYYVSKDGRVAVYMSAGRGGNTTLVLEVVDDSGRPVNFTAFLSGPTLDKFEDIGVAKGRGRGQVAIGRYVAEAAKLAVRLGYKPNEVRVGVVAFVTTVERRGNGTYLLTDVVTIPVGPGEAAGKEIVAKIKFKPRFEIELNATAARRDTEARTEVAVYETQSAPPEVIDAGCTGPIGYVTCYRYRAVQTYTSTEGVPLLLTYVDSHSSNFISDITHKHFISLSTQTTTTLSFEMSLAVFKKGVGSDEFAIEAPGPGFEIVLGQSSEKTLLDLSCRFYPSTSASCYSGGRRFTPASSRFSGDGLLATGLVGDVRAVKYVLEERWCYIDYFGAVYCSSWTPTSVEAWGVWLAGLWGTDSFLPYAEVDDNPNDGVGKLDHIYSTTLDLWIKGKIDKVQLPSYYDRYYPTSWYTLASTSQSTTHFAISIPVGAIMDWVILKRLGIVLPPSVSAALDSLGAGVSVATTRLDIFSYYASLDLGAYSPVSWAPSYFEYKNYFVKMAGNYYDVPVPIVNAYIPPRS
ncbi:hypothetical protein [Pyrobaculum aerophilum]|uniref:Uncharacterized protein n=1 Tax=Pyrobaculum aerophilum TaxID=13773 RepID=A0A371R6Z9_9CREN|nr:hypothetical protein [Pyrobaculum aerophilum]MCX8135975.1 hypothetical protein [Pyrobaculum aerophilum]RFA94616.1 hypothetical protein CGL51_09480 [Pyrobaculum aerophilum]RFB00279.1 hypothetical protein CGL52_01520 [Pyrobaculum aerophilum]